MLNKERIENNPYRILGVYVGSPVSVEVNHLNRIRAFSKVGQSASFQLMGDDLLQPIVRTEESAEAATQTLSLAKDRVENSLLWFSDGNSEWGRVLNDAVQSLIMGDYTNAINSYETLVSNDSLRVNFIESVTHGLLTMSRDELEIIISELICAGEHDLEGFWMSEGSKPSGRIAKILFEKTIPAKIENLIHSIGYYNVAGGIDFYEFITRFDNTLREIKPILKKTADVYGAESIQYRNIAEELYIKIYERGTYLIREIGKFIWLQGEKNRVNDKTYKKYNSKMPVGCIRACMDLIRRVDGIVTETAEWIQVDDISKRVLYPEIDTYQSVKRVEFVDRDDIIRHSVHSFYIKRGITIAGWLSFLYWMFWIV